jgi:hypothetical protein
MHSYRRCRSNVEGGYMACWLARNAVAVMFAIVVAGTLVILKQREGRSGGRCRLRCASVRIRGAFPAYAPPASANTSQVG